MKRKENIRKTEVGSRKTEEKGQRIKVKRTEPVTFNLNPEATKRNSAVFDYKIPVTGDLMYWQSVNAGAFLTISFLIMRENFKTPTEATCNFCSYETNSAAVHPFRGERGVKTPTEATRNFCSNKAGSFMIPQPMGVRRVKLLTEKDLTLKPSSGGIGGGIFCL